MGLGGPHKEIDLGFLKEGARKANASSLRGYEVCMGGEPERHRYRDVPAPGSALVKTLETVEGPFSPGSENQDKALNPKPLLGGMLGKIVSEALWPSGPFRIGLPTFGFPKKFW